MTGTWSS